MNSASASSPVTRPHHAMHAKGLLVPAMGLLLGPPGCVAGEEQTQIAALVDHDLWQFATPDNDPFANLRPSGSVCEPDSHRAEPFGGAPAYEISTADCSFITLEQPLLQPLEAGRQARIRLWHFALSAPDPSEMIAAIAVNDEVVWENATPIPSEGSLIDQRWPLEVDAMEGDSIHFHLRNHGINSYALLEISAEVSG